MRVEGVGVLGQGLRARSWGGGVAEDSRLRGGGCRVGSEGWGVRGEG